MTTLQKIRLGLEWFLNPDHLPFLIGLERGWFAEAGIDLELVEPSEHMDAFEALGAGDLDLAITEPIHLVEDVAAGKDVVGVARFLHTNGGVLTLKTSGIERPRDMATKRVQYPGAPGPVGLAIVRTMIEADGGPAAAALTPVNNGFHHCDALIENKADVATLAFYNFEGIEAAARGHEPRLFALKDWGVPDFCQLILIGHQERFERQHQTWARILGVVQRGLDEIHQHPQATRALYFSATKTAPDDAVMNQIFDATVPCFTFDFDLSPRYFSQLGQWMRTRGLIKDIPENVWRPIAPKRSPGPDAGEM